MNNVAERVKKIVAGNLFVDAGKVVENASFIDDLGADSLGAVELMLTLEEEFNVEINDEVAAKILTVGDAINFIRSNATATES